MTTLTPGISFKLLTTTAQMQKMAANAIADYFNRIMPEVASYSIQYVSTYLPSIFRDSIVYKDIINGPLDAHMGIPHGEAVHRIDAILKKIGNSTQAKIQTIRFRSGGFSGGLELFCIKGDFTDIMGMVESLVITRKGGVLPWMEWLLTKGDTIVLRNFSPDTEHDYGIIFGPFPTSRSGKALMIKIGDKNVSIISPWRVPPQYSGTINNNWITRQLIRSQGELNKIFDQAFQFGLGKAIANHPT